MRDIFLGLGVATLDSIPGQFRIDELLGVSDWQARDYLLLGTIAVAACFVLIKITRLSRAGMSRVSLLAHRTAAHTAISVRQLGAVLDMLTDSVAVVDGANKIIWANEAMARRLELPRHGIEGTDVSQLIPTAVTIRELGEAVHGRGLRAVVFKPLATKTELKIVA
ncbi:MAG: PAS domain-containing protein [Planctomycetota bacterium]|nr:PAS domain-containing protein [Planctomycetota bacterium]